MKNFIHNLLQQSGFYPVENDNTTLFIGNDDNPRKSYWVILERDDLDFLEIQNKVFSDCRSLVKKPDFDKNCSLVILLKITEETDLVELKKTTLLIEENPYYFKKYVLIYKDEEYEHLIIKKEDKPERQFLENQITNRECFNTYKANPQTHNWQSLVFRMALKFPFVNITVHVKTSLNSLFDDNLTNLTKKNINNLDSQVTHYFNTLTVEDIGELKAEDILNNLNLNKPKDGL